VITDSVKLIFSGVISTQLWFAALLANVGVMTLLAFTDDELFPNLSGGATAILSIIIIVGAIAFFVTHWKLTRAMALVHADEQGDVGAWIVWSVVAMLPGSLISLLLVFGSDKPLFWLLNSFISGAASCLLVPLLVHAAGRAINRNSPSRASIIDYWWSRYARLFVAYFIASVPLTMISDALDHYGKSTPAVAILSTFVSSILYFIVTVLTIAVTVIAYREAEAGKPLSAI
jgi:hypothetical protein